jgi:hypothetical protein
MRNNTNDENRLLAILIDFLSVLERFVELE